MRASVFWLPGLLVSTLALAQNVGPRATVFVTRCAGCHGTDGNGGELGPAIVGAHSGSAPTRICRRSFATACPRRHAGVRRLSAAEAGRSDSLSADAHAAQRLRPRAREGHARRRRHARRAGPESEPRRHAAARRRPPDPPAAQDRRRATARSPRRPTGRATTARPTATATARSRRSTRRNVVAPGAQVDLQPAQHGAACR